MGGGVGRGGRGCPSDWTAGSRGQKTTAQRLRGSGMSVAYQRVQARLERLKLKRVADLLDPIAEEATKESLSYVDFLDRLLEAESTSRAERRLIAKTQLAHFPFHKTLADFDFSFQPSIDRKQIQELATLRFLAHGENVILLGPPGVGKTHLAIALGM